MVQAITQKPQTAFQPEVTAMTPKMKAPPKKPPTPPRRETRSQTCLFMRMAAMTPRTRPAARHPIEPPTVFIHPKARAMATKTARVKMQMIVAATIGKSCVPKRAMGGPTIK